MTLVIERRRLESSKARGYYMSILLILDHLQISKAEKSLVFKTYVSEQIVNQNKQMVSYDL